MPKHGRRRCQNPLTRVVSPERVRSYAGALRVRDSGQLPITRPHETGATGSGVALRELHVEHRVQLDPVRGDTALAVDVVENPDPRDPSSGRATLQRSSRSLGSRCRSLLRFHFLNPCGLVIGRRTGEKSRWIVTSSLSACGRSRLQSWPQNGASRDQGSRRSVERCTFPCRRAGSGQN